MSNFANVRWWHPFPDAWVTALQTAYDGYFVNTANGILGAPLPPMTQELGYVATGVGPLADINNNNDQNYWFLFYESGFCGGDLVAYDLAQGKYAQYAVNLRKAMRVPSVVRQRVTGWTYQEYDADLAARVTAALAISLPYGR